MQLKFDNRIINELPADPEAKNFRRQVHNAVYSFVKPTPVAKPQLIAHWQDVADSLGISDEQASSQQFADVFSGNASLDGMQPYAMCYGGHQFGNWAGQLGDGRAINLGELVNAKGEHWALQLKGSGLTPYSRTADGLAVLRSSIREFVCSEAMHYLGVPTTRALSLCLSGEQVMRDMLYNGNAEYEPGAIVCRAAPSFLRFGNYQIFASRNQYKELRQLADFTIEHHFTHLLEQHPKQSAELYTAWFAEVCQLTADMIVAWMRVGFVHGVMNTDNMSILGLTIDYGPYGWLDDFNPEWTPNTTDSQNKRYRYSQQPNIALWNLYQLANALYPLIEQTDPLEQALHSFQSDYSAKWQQMMADKLGLETLEDGDNDLFTRLEKLLGKEETDMTLFYRLLSEQEVATVDDLTPVYYQSDSLNDTYKEEMQSWLNEYAHRISKDSRTQKDRFTAMQKHNPKFVFRNYLAQQAIDQAHNGDYSMLHELMQVLQRPYTDQADMSHYAQKRPDWARTKVGCSMLSCSS